MNLNFLKKIRIIESIDNGRHHISMSLPSRIPTWEEIKYIRNKYGDPEKFYVMVLPPKKHYVNFHPYCMHLWEVQSKEETDCWSDDMKALRKFGKE